MSADELSCLAPFTSALLAGRDPGRPADWRAFGPFEQPARALYDAFLTGGAAQAAAIASAVARMQPELASLFPGLDVQRICWTVPELYAAQFPAPPFVVPGLLPAGVSILAGRPKAGKSWLALQIAAAVATGGAVFGRPVAPGSVLYLALEDSPRRLRDRLHRQSVPAGAAITFYTRWDLDGGCGLQLLQERAAGCALAVIDTFSRIAGPADQMDIAQMTLLLSILQQGAAHSGLAVLLVDHHRKSAQADADPVDDIMGSTAKAGVVDAALGLYRRRDGSPTLLKVTGRDVEERQLAVRFDAETCCWQEVSGQSAASVSLTERVVAALEQVGGEATTQELAQLLQHDQGHVSRALHALHRAGVVARAGRRGRCVPYRLAQTAPARLP